jgi:hypothetical protein
MSPTCTEATLQRRVQIMQEQIGELYFHWVLSTEAATASVHVYRNMRMFERDHAFRTAAKRI